MFSVADGITLLPIFRPWRRVHLLKNISSCFHVPITFAVGSMSTVMRTPILAAALDNLLSAKYTVSFAGVEVLY